MTITLDAVKKSINDFFSDTTRPASQTREGLEEIRDDVDSKLEALAEDAND
jgi:hypothetical protein